MTALNQLGLGDLAARVAREPELSTARQKEGGEADDLVFAASLREAISAIKEQQGTQGIEASSLAQLYRTAVIPGISTTARVSDPIANSQASANESDTVSTGSTDSTSSTASAPASSISEVVFSTGYSNAELLSKITNANTVEERLGYASELRDKIVEALNNAGYTAAAAESADKLTVDGKTYDVIKSSRGIGRNTAVQLIEVEEGAGASSSSSGVANAIYKAGESGLSLLRQISASFSVSERKHLASQIQQMMVDHLNANGYTASTTDSADKIVVDGVTYDVIRGLNAPGGQAQYQVMKVG